MPCWLIFFCESCNAHVGRTVDSHSYLRFTRRNQWCHRWRQHVHVDLLRHGDICDKHLLEDANSRDFGSCNGVCGSTVVVWSHRRCIYMIPIWLLIHGCPSKSKKAIVSYTIFVENVTISNKHRTSTIKKTRWWVLGAKRQSGYVLPHTVRCAGAGQSHRCGKRSAPLRYSALFQLVCTADSLYVQRATRQHSEQWSHVPSVRVVILPRTS